MFAIMRFRKLKNISSITGQLNHIQREVYVPNAKDGGQNNLNMYIKKSTFYEIKNELNECKKRKDSVLCYDILLTASPEFFTGKDGTLGQKWLDANMQFIAENFGGAQNIMAASVHFDENTPHLHLLVLPRIQTDRGPKLAAKSFTGNKQLCELLQDKYAEKMAKFGLIRGIRGSRRKHVSIKNYYKDPNNAVNRRNRELRAENVKNSKLINEMHKKLKYFQDKYEKPPKTNNLGDPTVGVPKPPATYSTGKKPGL